MGNQINCIDGPELARRLEKAAGKRETGRGSLSTYSSALQKGSEDIERLTKETGSSFEWLRHLQTALLGDRVVLVLSGWDRRLNCEGIWIWERDEKDRTLLRGLRKAEAAEVLTERIIPIDQSSNYRLQPLKDTKDVRIALFAALVPDEHWSAKHFSRRADDEDSIFPYHES